MSNCISGISCAINECKHHNGNTGCTASSINVGGSSGYTAVIGDTASVPSCTTFAKR